MLSPADVVIGCVAFGAGISLRTTDLVFARVLVRLSSRQTLSQNSAYLAQFLSYLLFLGILIALAVFNKGRNISALVIPAAVAGMLIGRVIGRRNLARSKRR